MSGLVCVMCCVGWTGERCERNIDECDLSLNDSMPLCHNGGVCVDTPGSYTCNCTNTGYSGMSSGLVLLLLDLIQLLVNAVVVILTLIHPASMMHCATHERRHCLSTAASAMATPMSLNSLTVLHHVCHSLPGT